MNRVLRGVGLIACFFAWLGPGCVLGAQAIRSAESPKIIAVLPANFKGWACIDFGVAGSPRLPRVGDALIVRPRQGAVLKTSDKPGEFPRIYEAWFEIDGQRCPLPNDFKNQREMRIVYSKQTVQRYCVFYGTENDADAAAEPPGFEPSSHENQGVSVEERRALVSLYEATGGDHWTRHVGWLGPPGTECKWHGVRCWSEPSEPASVTGLALSQNNLVGPIPHALGHLSHLDELMIYGNHLSGLLPQKLINRWLSGSLQISAEAPLLTDVSRIEFELDPSALLCGLSRIRLSSNGHAVLFTKRCRNATPKDRTTFCEIKEGEVPWGQFAALAWLLEKNGFYDLQASYSRDVSDSTFETTRVIRNGKHFKVENYAHAGPFELWIVQTGIQGVASWVEWKKITTQPECPKWDEPLGSQQQ